MDKTAIYATVLIVNSKRENWKMKTGLMKGAVVLASLVTLVAAAEAQVLLGDANSAVRINTAPGVSLMDLWEVEGVNRLGELDYFYRIGSTGPEARLSTISPLAGFWAVDSNPFSDTRNDTASLLYSVPGLVNVELKISLVGGQDGSGWSDVTHQVKISNTSGQLVDFHLFQYANFDFGSGQVGEIGKIFSPGSVMQGDANYQAGVSETVSLCADHWEMGVYPGLLDSLTDNQTTVLSDNCDPVMGDDLEYVLQWDIDLEPGQSVILAKDMLVIPEPSSVALLGVISGVGLFIRRRFV